MKREFLQSLMEMPKEVVDAIMAENGRDIEGAKEGARQWEEKYRQAVAENEKAIQELRFDAHLQGAIAREKGRNAKAIAALLDTEALKNADAAAVLEAVQAVKKDCGYLFEAAIPPAYAEGTGVTAPEVRGPATLADALRERFEKR